MDSETLLSRQKNFHEIYQERLASANGKAEAMALDLADFDKGIELLLQGLCHRECKMVIPRFTTVYGWIVNCGIPSSFRNYSTSTSLKKVDPSLFEDLPNFAYFVGACQAKTKNIPSNTWSIPKRDFLLEKEVSRCFNSLHIGNRKERADNNDGGQKPRVYYCSSGLMSYISEITERNSCVPHLFFTQEMMIPYISGFFDARAVLLYSRNKVQCSDIVRKYPLVRIIKKGNVPLMRAVNSAIHFIGVDSVYTPEKNPNRIHIAKLESIKKVIDLSLFRNSGKMERLTDLYTEWDEIKELDYRGAFNRLKEKVLLERLDKMAPYIDDYLDEDDD